MAGTDPLVKHYHTLTGHERCVLSLEAMARGDDVEDGRLEATCPKYLYSMEDWEFRSRMNYTFTAAALACAEVKRHLACVRLIQTFAAMQDVYRHWPADIAEEAFYAGLYHRDLPLGEVGDEWDEAEPAEPPADPELEQRVEELREEAGQGAVTIMKILFERVGANSAAELLSVWAALGRFSRECLGVEPLVLATAWRLLDDDPAAEIQAMYPDAKPDASLTNHWYSSMTNGWEKRFADEH